MAKQLMIGDRLFKTKKAAIEFMRPLLNAPPLDSVIVEPGHNFLIDLVALHPDATQKIGHGISHFTVERNAYAQRGFRLHRTDGTSTDFSVYKCFDGKHNRKAQVQLALRTAIMDQVTSFREKQFLSGRAVCPVSGATLNRDDCHVDHESPATFEVLSQQWIREENLTFETVFITPSADNKQGREMTQKGQIASWQAFHQRFARLRLVSVRANLSDAKIRHNRTPGND